ncbi:baseplate J/gp47 family protein [Acutalibacter muris]|uniref:baseplate J/gp47 family protein n=2 Tax=Acutalibacter muris TaxID=1796620 RepID=UPI00272C6FB0|nr:baseplate J/gp47 family protein [Acutalibacter muris]
MRNPEYQFTDASIEALEARLVQDYENFSGAAVQPGSPERVIIQWVASILTHERALMNYIGNQNLPSRAEGENLDALAELMYLPKRPQAAAAVCTQRFHISEPQQSAILVPKGTRVTSSGGPIWETVEDVYVNIGDSYTDAQARCQTTGAVGNGYMPGQLNTLIDMGCLAGFLRTLAIAGEIDDKYATEEGAFHGAELYQSCTCNCLRDNYMVTGSTTLQPEGMIKLLLNGAIDYIMEEKENVCP